MAGGEGVGTRIVMYNEKQFFSFLKNKNKERKKKKKIYWISWSTRIAVVFLGDSAS